MTFRRRDVLTKKTKALPATASSVYTDSLDLRRDSSGGHGDHMADVELLVSAPALTNAQLGNAHTMKYTVQHSHNDSVWEDLYTDEITQTGAGAGAAAATKRFRLPTNVYRYVRVKATASAADDASDASMTAELYY